MIRSVLGLSGLALALTTATCTHAATASHEPGFRVRADINAPLNTDQGWAGDVNESVRVDADQPFRLRFVARSNRRDDLADRYGLQYRRNGGEWVDVEAHDFPLPERVIELDFTQADPANVSEGWAGGPGFERVRDAGGEILAIRPQESAALDHALYSAPWPLKEPTIGVEFRLPADGRTQMGLIFGTDSSQAGYTVVFDPASNQIQLVRQHRARAPAVLASRDVDIPADQWLDAQVELTEDALHVDFQDGAVSFSFERPDTLQEVAAGLHLDGPVQLRSFMLEDVPHTPRTSIMSAAAYAQGDPTEPVISSSLEFVGGSGVALRARTENVRAEAGGHGEFEWPLVIRRFTDGALTNEVGDTFEFRMIDFSGERVNTGPNPVVTLQIPEGHLGGTFVETPGRIGPFQASNGDLYFIMEPAESDNLFMMVKSDDDGRTWREVDGANRPATGDLEAVDARQVGDTIHILHQITEDVLHHTFQTSDHPSLPDRWAITDEVAASGDAVSQMATLARRSDGGLVFVYLDDTLRYTVRSPGGDWSPAHILDAESQGLTAGPHAVLGRGDTVHIAYYEAGGALWHRRLEADGSLSGRQWLADGAGVSDEDYGAVLPLVFLDDSDTLVIAYRLDDGSLWERRIIAGAAPTPAVRVTSQPVIRHAVDSQQPAADLFAHGDTLHALFVDARDRSLYLTRDCGDTWSAPVLQVSDINGSWVRGGVYTRSDGASVLGYVYDAGSKGGAGMNRFAEIELDGLAACR